MRVGTVLLAAIAMASLARAQQDSRKSPENVQRVTEKVRKQLVALVNYGVFDAIGFQLVPAQNGFQVVLKGYASRPTLKDSAARVAKSVEDVQSVDNQIEVLPLSRHDDDIRRAAYVRIYHHPSLSRYNPNRGAPVYGSPWGWRRTQTMGISNDPPPGVHPISIIVKNGNITLIGLVDHEMDRNLAAMLAGQVPGSFQVNNQLVAIQKRKSK